MSVLPWIQGAPASRERLVGLGHPTYEDVLNRALRAVLTDSGLDPDSDFPGFLSLLGGTISGPLTVAGAITAQGGVLDSVTIVTKTANYAATSADRLILADTTTNAVQVTLQAAAARGPVPLIVKNLGADNTCTVVASGTDTIDEATTITLAQWESAMLVPDGTGRYVRVNRAPGSGAGGGGGGGPVGAADVAPGSFQVGAYTFPTSLAVGAGITVTGLVTGNGLVSKGGAVWARTDPEGQFVASDAAGNFPRPATVLGSAFNVDVGAAFAGLTRALEVSDTEILANVPIRAAAGVLGEPAVRVVTTDTTTTEDDQIILVDASGGPVTVTMGQISSFGRRVEQLIRRIDSSANVVALAASGTDVIDGPTTVAAGQTVDLLSDTDSDPDTWRSLGTSSSGGSVSAADVQPGTFAGAFIFAGGTLAFNGTSVSSNAPTGFNSSMRCYGIVGMKSRSVGNVTGAVTWNIADGWCTRAVLTGNLTLTLNGWYQDYTGRIILTQDAVGGHTLTMPPGCVLPSGFAMPSAANAGLVMDLYHDGATLRVVHFSTF